MLKPLGLSIARRNTRVAKEEENCWRNCSCIRCKRKPQTGEVIAVGEGRVLLENGTKVPMEVKLVTQ